MLNYSGLHLNILSLKSFLNAPMQSVAPYFVLTQVPSLCYSTYHKFLYPLNDISVSFSGAIALWSDTISFPKHCPAEPKFLLEHQEVVFWVFFFFLFFGFVLFGTSQLSERGNPGSGSFPLKKKKERKICHDGPQKHWRGRELRSQ